VPERTHPLQFLKNKLKLKLVTIYIVCSVENLLISCNQLNYLFIEFDDKRDGKYTDSRIYFHFNLKNFNLSDLQQQSD